MKGRRRRALDDLDQDLRDHIELEIQENIGRGMAPDEARRAALRAFGNITLIKEDVRAVWLPTWLEQLIQDVRYALRQWQRNPGFTLVAVTMIGLGLGVNAAVFTVTDAVLFKGFPLVESNDRILYIDSPKNGNGCCVSYPDFEDWRAQSKAFEGMTAVRGVGAVLTDPRGPAESVVVTQMSAGTFKLIGVRPVLGRDFAPADEVRGAAPVVILEHDFWERRYAKDAAILGQSIKIDGIAHMVIGVMPQGFSFPQRQDLWVPLIRTPDLEDREARSLWMVVGRLARGASVDDARIEMEMIGRGLESAYPAANRGFLPRVRRFHEFFIGPDATMIYGSMWAAAVFVLVIACANLANLLLGRLIGRSREISIRIAVGAGRLRIVRQLLIENLMLAGLGTILGWWIAKWGIRAYKLAEWPAGARSWRVLDYTMDNRVLGYLLAISLASGILFGLVPAFRLWKSGLNAGLSNGGLTAGRRSRRLSGILVIVEVALAVVLLGGAGVMVHSFLNIYTAGLGIDTSNLFIAGLALPPARYPYADDQIFFFDRLGQRLRTVTGIESVTITNRLPAGGYLTLPYQLEDEDQRTLATLIVGVNYFQTLGARVQSGREFNASDTILETPVAIVNQRFASTYWPAEDPIGKTLRLLNGRTGTTWLTVVGVVSNIVQDPARQRIDPLVYLPHGQHPAGGLTMIVRTRVPPREIGSAFRREVQALDSDLPILDPSTLKDRVMWSYWNTGFYGGLFLIFASVALLLASVGIYAVAADSVSQRTQEIGIRMAMGATPYNILRLVFREGLPVVAIGLAVGLAGAFALTGAMKAILVHVSSADPIAFLVACVALLFAATLGCGIPAYRATRVDPAVAVRHD